MSHRSILEEWNESSADYSAVLTDFWAKEHDIVRLYASACFFCTLNFEVVAKTVQDRTDILITTIQHMTESILRAGNSGFFWVAATPNMALLLEMHRGFEPLPVAGGSPFDNQRCIKRNGVQDLGTLYKKWRVFSVDALRERGSQCMLVGVNNKEESPTSYARIGLT